MTTVIEGPMDAAESWGAVPSRSQRFRPSHFGRWFTSTGWRHLVGIPLCLIAVFPLLYVVSTALSTNATLTGSNELFASVGTDNFERLLNDPSRPFARWFFNTVAIASVTALLAVLMGAMAAYAFSRLRFAGRRVGLGAIVITQMFPQFLGVVAIFLLLTTLGDAIPALGLNSLSGLIAVYLGGALGVNTYLMYGYFNTVPREIDEAAKLDGASHSRIFFTIVLRLVSPVLVVVGMLVFIGISGEFVIASVALSDTDSYTVPVGLYSMVSMFRNDNWGVFCAGAVIAAVPVMLVFLYAQKFIVSGLFAGSSK